MPALVLPCEGRVHLAWGLSAPPGGAPLRSGAGRRQGPPEPHPGTGTPGAPAPVA